MSAIEFIGFIVSFLAMIILFFKRTLEKKRREENPELYEEMEHRREAQLKEFLRSLDVQDEEPLEEDEEEDEEEPFVPPPVHVLPQQKAVDPYSPPRPSRRIVRDDFQYKTRIEEVKQHTSIESRRLPARLEDRYQSSCFGGKVVSADMMEEEEHDPYAIDLTKEEGRAEKILDRLESIQDIVILQEIIGPPKALESFRNR